MHDDHPRYQADLPGHSPPSARLFRTERDVEEKHDEAVGEPTGAIAQRGNDDQHEPVETGIALFPEPDRESGDDESYTPFHRPVLRLTYSAFDSIMQDLTKRPFRRERAGILLGPSEDDDLVTHYERDHSGKGTPVSFTLNAVALNQVLLRYKRARMTCLGFAHAHPDGVTKLSGGDLAYVQKLFANPKNNLFHVHMPVVCNGRMHPYVVTQTGVHIAELVLI